MNANGATSAPRRESTEPRPAWYARSSVAATSSAKALSGRITSSLLADRDAHRLGQPRSQLGLELRLRVGARETADVHPGDRDARKHGVAHHRRADEQRRAGGQHDQGDDRGRSSPPGCAGGGESRVLGLAAISAMDCGG